MQSRLQAAVGRDLSLFVKNKFNIVLSALSIVVVMSLYFIFLRDFVLQMVANVGIDQKEQEIFADRLMVAGLLIVVTTTTCFGVIQIAVKDKESGVKKDYLTSPAEPMTIAAGYWITAAIVSSCFTVMTFLAYESYFSYRYGSMLSFGSIGKAILLLVLSSSLNAGILLGISFFIQNTTDFSTFANLYGTIIGFLAGAYLPYFFYGGIVRKTLFFLPCTQLTSLMRQICLKEELALLHNEFSTVQLAGIKRTFGITLSFQKETVSACSQLSMVILSMAVVLLLVRIFSGVKKKG